jgi:hypothetical protein
MYQHPGYLENGGLGRGILKRKTSTRRSSSAVRSLEYRWKGRRKIQNAALEGPDVAKSSAIVFSARRPNPSQRILHKLCCNERRMKIDRDTNLFNLDPPGFPGVINRATIYQNI